LFNGELDINFDDVCNKKYSTEYGHYTETMNILFLEYKL